MFIYGNTGLGKTHLAHAIGIQTKINYPDQTILYVTCEQFLQQFVNSVRNHTQNDFIHFYQMIDMLIVDDIHNLSGKDKTQDVFFQIFNDLHQSGKQLIITSDKAPAELSGIEPRLLSRFKWGLTVDLQVPSIETRIAILHQKLYTNGVEMPNDVIEYIAYNITTNIRELEGIMNTLLAQSVLNKKNITIELAKQMIDKFVKTNDKEISIEYIQKMVCDYYHVPYDKINHPTRTREIVQARQLSMYFAKRLTKNSLAVIGTQCGKKDHSTVLHACRTINNLIDTDKRFKQEVEEIERKIKSRD